MQFRFRGTAKQAVEPIVRMLLIVALLGVFFARARISFAQETVQTHIVQPGEYLSTIASRYGVSPSALIRANGISNPDMLRVGQVLTIPSGGTGATTAPPVSTPQPQAETAEPASTQPAQYIPHVQSAAPAAAPAAASAQDVLYTVYPGESISSIAAKYGISASAIVARNLLPSPTIYSGQRLIIPAGVVSAPQRAVPTATIGQPVRPAATPTQRAAPAQIAPRPTRAPSYSAIDMPLRTIPRLILPPTVVATPATLRR